MAACAAGSPLADAAPGFQLPDASVAPPRLSALLALALTVWEKTRRQRNTQIDPATVTIPTTPNSASVAGTKHREVCACSPEQDGFELPVLFLKLRDDAPW